DHDGWEDLEERGLRRRGPDEQIRRGVPEQQGESKDRRKDRLRHGRDEASADPRLRGPCRRREEGGEEDDDREEQHEGGRCEEAAEERNEKTCDKPAETTAGRLHSEQIRDEDGGASEERQDQLDMDQWREASHLSCGGPQDRKAG